MVEEPEAAGAPLGREQALERVLAHARPLASEQLPLAAAWGRVLAESVCAGVDLPPFDASAMDGYAVRSADLPGRLRVVGHVSAGAPALRPLGAGETMAIATGAEVPAGADAVVPLEEVVRDAAWVHVPRAPKRGEHVRPRGGDLTRGDVAVATGARLGPAQLAALAASGATDVRCARVPTVRLVVTGSELRQPGEPLRPGEIYEANGLMLAAQARNAGAVAGQAHAVADDAHATCEAITRGLEADVLITSGGVSVGTRDYVRAAAAAAGVEEVFWRVAVKPGGPVAFGTYGSTLVFSLAGNPVSSLVGFELFVRPALLALQGVRDPRPRYLPARLASPLAMLRERESLVRARRRIEPGAVVLEPLSGQESHMIAHAASADALILIPRGEGVVEEGSLVSYLALD